MNEYGHLAMRHWQRWLPSRFETIPEKQRETFFTDLGEQVSEQILSAEDAMLLAVPGNDLDYLAKVGHLNMARLRAKELVLEEMVFLDPEPGTEVSQDSEDLDESPTDALATWRRPDGMPQDRDHPLWAMLEDDTVSTQEFSTAAAEWEKGLERQLTAYAGSSGPGEQATT